MAPFRILAMFVMLIGAVQLAANLWGAISGGTLERIEAWWIVLLGYTYQPVAILSLGAIVFILAELVDATRSPHRSSRDSAE